MAKAYSQQCQNIIGDLSKLNGADPQLRVKNCFTRLTGKLQPQCTYFHCELKRHTHGSNAGLQAGHPLRSFPVNRLESFTKSPWRGRELTSPVVAWMTTLIQPLEIRTQPASETSPASCIAKPIGNVLEVLYVMNCWEFCDKSKCIIAK